MGVSKYKSLKDIQNRLNVSLATVNNWIKTGVIPQPDSPLGFSNDTFKEIIEKVTSSQSSKLKGRANRSMIDEKFICYLGITDQYLKLQLQKAIETYEESTLTIDEGVLSLSISLLLSSNLLSIDWYNNPQTKIESFLLSWTKECNSNINEVMTLFHGFKIPNNDDDFIGAFYQSIQSVASKSKLGSYYTPSVLLEDIKIPLGKTVLDPCCGSGGILLNVLNKSHNSDQIFAWDIDETALKICRVNLCLFFNNPEISPNIKKHDIIFEFNDSLYSTNKEPNFDYIITNPPWGSKFSRQQKDLLAKEYPILKTTESFSIILYNSINYLAKDGELIFFLPHSFLNVSTHSNIRKYLSDKRKALTIKLLGNAFKGVMSEAIRIKISNSEIVSNEIIVLSDDQDPTTIPFNTLKKPDYIISATASNADFDLIQKVYEHKHLLLKNNAKFALGIVTGNNDKHLLKNPSGDSEPIFRGKDISPFCFKLPQYNIEFNPSIYQQVAPVELYRQKKIAYRFISDKIVCVLDSENRLLLNSANLFIPTLDYPFETIVMLFNSKLYTFIYRKKYHSKKVLRSHIESFPLPLLSENEHQSLKYLHDKYKTGNVDIFEFNQAVYSLFNLDTSEIEIIEKDI